MRNILSLLILICKRSTAVQSVKFDQQLGASAEVLPSSGSFEAISAISSWRFAASQPRMRTVNLLPGHLSRKRVLQLQGAAPQL